MKISKMIGLILMLTLLTTGSVVFAKKPVESPSPAGYWETISDVTHKPRSVMYLFEKEGILYGKVVKSLVPGETFDRPCDKCSGEFHNQPIANMQVLWGLKEKNGEWKGGKVLDPDTGNVYRCKLAISEDGEKARVRGYIGISLLGRTQTWSRIKNYSNN